MLEAHVIASGSDGNCTVIQCDDYAIMIDAGLSCKRLMSLMETASVDSSLIKSILITHEHSDHVIGAGPTARFLNIPIMCNENTHSQWDFGKVDYKPFKTLGNFNLGPLNITPLPTSHNAAEPNAFLVEADGQKILLATDTGVLTFPVKEALKEADVAIIESNYDSKMLANGPYPPSLKKHIAGDTGHLSNVDCATAINNCYDGKKKIFLAHLSKKNNTPDVARETVSQITGIKRFNIDCLEFQGDTRTIRL